MISISLRSAMRWCLLCYAAGATFGFAVIPTAVAFILEQLRKYGVTYP
jgi:hypothetical protein